MRDCDFRVVHFELIELVFKWVAVRNNVDFELLQLTPVVQHYLILRVSLLHSVCIRTLDKRVDHADHILLVVNHLNKSTFEP